MKTKTIILTRSYVLYCSGRGLCQRPKYGHLEAQRGQVEDSRRQSKNTTVVYEAAGDNVKVTADGVDREGKPTHGEWTGKFDGKDYPLLGDSAADMRAYKKVDDRTMDLTNKKGEKATTTGRIVVAADGKTRTVTVSGTDAKG